MFFLPSTSNTVIVVATPKGLNASNLISPESSGNTSLMVKIDVPSSYSSIMNSFEFFSSSPCLNHLPFGFGLPMTFDSILIFFQKYKIIHQANNSTQRFNQLNVYLVNWPSLVDRTVGSILTICGAKSCSTSLGASYRYEIL
jgi:hypothetical protein